MVEFELHTSIFKDINDVVPNFLMNHAKVHVIDGNLFVFHQAFGEPITTWFKGNGQMYIFHAKFEELKNGNFNILGFPHVYYARNAYNGNPVDGYREKIHQLIGK